MGRKALHSFWLSRVHPEAHVRHSSFLPLRPRAALAGGARSCRRARPARPPQRAVRPGAPRVAEPLRLPGEGVGLDYTVLASAARCVCHGVCLCGVAAKGSATFLAPLDARCARAPAVAKGSQTNAACVAKGSRTNACCCVATYVAPLPQERKSCARNLADSPSAPSAPDLS